MRRILLIGIAAIVAACGSGDVVDPPASPSPASVAGTYQVATADGQRLPSLVLDLGAYQVRLVSGTLALDANGSYALTLELRVDDSGNVRTHTDHDAGVWSLARDSITLVSTTFDMTSTGAVSDGAITLQFGSRALVLRK